ncbi:HAD-IA family hydrolase [Streptomyces sp. NPDC051018]|uniref:HAD-IA family hydrolase n=1 Tax=Streptomyces sp. NPDC051018 TaxID=3365639 RepID=UPI0037AD24C2
MGVPPDGVWGRTEPQKQNRASATVRRPPRPAHYRTVCPRLGVRPEDCLFVDDVPGHVAAAREVGMEGHLFEDNLRAMVRIARHLAAVPGLR